MRSFWVVNTNPDHWEICEEGPKDQGVHGDNVGKPWHGLPEGSRPSSPKGVNRDDVFLVRQTSRPGSESGVKGVWLFYDYAMVKSQKDVPEEWKRHEKKLRDYRWFIYCRPSTRILSPLYKENWSKLGIHHGRLTGTMIRLKEKEKRSYIEELLRQGGSGGRYREPI
ncbi:hypothetical protein AKJ54_00230 [candidate division MSBL1 archaeon SCGC-AAA382K21]|uniref:EVE domain-containing protein n=1 Tax=candidate division MSBL1 archaeon SCGC-AAA382K21 TaxID=1698283 RepID=A0A133VM42_9EURY|nr:hypothetical protein AKJ54_00230 [candidate division MSBL1 archaeon SCGC-AAA382K21]